MTSRKGAGQGREAQMPGYLVPPADVHPAGLSPNKLPVYPASLFPKHILVTNWHPTGFATGEEKALQLADTSRLDNGHGSGAGGHRSSSVPGQPRHLCAHLTTLSAQWATGG